MSFIKRSFACVIFCLLFLDLISPLSAQQQTPQQAQPLKQEVPPTSVQNVKGNIYQIKGETGAKNGFRIRRNQLDLKKMIANNEFREGGVRIRKG